MKPIESSELISLTAVNRRDNAKSRKIYAKSRAEWLAAECNRAIPTYICRAITVTVYSANGAPYTGDNKTEQQNSY